MMRAIIGGEPARFVPYADLYRRALGEFGAPELPVGAHSPGHVAASDAEAREQLFPHFKANRHRLRRARGRPPLTRAPFQREATPGAAFVGSPATLAQQLADPATQPSQRPETHRCVNEGIPPWRT